MRVRSEFPAALPAGDSCPVLLAAGEAAPGTLPLMDVVLARPAGICDCSNQFTGWRPATALHAGALPCA